MSTITAVTAVTQQEAPCVLTEVRGQVGCITLNRPKVHNALRLEMLCTLSHCLQAWRDHPAVKAVPIRGVTETGPFGAFCAGAIRFFHQAALAGNPAHCHRAHQNGDV